MGDIFICHTLYHVLIALVRALRSRPGKSTLVLSTCVPEAEPLRAKLLDAAPDLRIPATISFVASVAQFTPKTVETHDERLKLMFRVKARIPPELLRQHLEYVKTGLPGMAWVRLDERVPWPDDLNVRLSQ